MEIAPRRALILVDVQNEYFNGPLKIRRPDPTRSLPQILRVVDGANDADIPVVCVRHMAVPGAPVFDPARPGHRLHECVEARRLSSWKDLEKRHASIYAGTGLAEWLRELAIDTVTLVGYQSNNCILASAVEGEALGFATEVLSDATGAIHISNDVGSIDAGTLHEALMTLLHSNWATVMDSDSWLQAVSEGGRLPHSNLVVSALRGAELFDDAP
ncbi:isochorismatase family protein [Actinomyces succiniciruminis]|uniref:Isochorismatase protein n=1 Tax=Actinomyces succiniciruminis TaxID=1522002 RepID=A0A1L7RSR9_9ACTO|nr:isochorismatase family protein [Actinomyces succiniciruminis]CED92678.1 Isochorismatase protein [Actinomyces succiniciruminis]